MARANTCSFLFTTNVMTTRRRRDGVECCAICLEVLPLPSQETPVTVLPCGHCFHESCAMPLWRELIHRVNVLYYEMDVPDTGLSGQLHMALEETTTTPCPICRRGTTLAEPRHVPKRRKLTLRQRQNLRKKYGRGWIHQP